MMKERKEMELQETELKEKELNETEMEQISGSGALDYLKEYGHEQMKDDHWSLW
jgi:hypothetical protein